MMQREDHVEKAVRLVLARSGKPPEDVESVPAERVHLPMIPLSFSKHRAIPQHFLRVLFPEDEQNDEPNEQDEKPVASIFFRDYEDRGEHNRDKKIYLAGVTPDLYRDKYRPKIEKFLDEFFSEQNEGQGLPGLYQDLYFDLYWDLHLGVDKEQARGLPTKIGMEFNLLLGLLGSEDENDLVRLEEATRFAASNNSELNKWIEKRLPSAPDHCFAYYWIRNKMKEGDVVFEVFHNFLAFSQWGNTMHQTMELLRTDESVRRSFERAMEAEATPEDPGPADEACAFSPLDRFVMELFRIIVPNSGSMSARPQAMQSDDEDEEQVVSKHLHKEISQDPLHWSDPEAFDPDRFIGRRVSSEIDAEESERLGFPRCPFEHGKLEVADGREDVEIVNDAFGTDYSLRHGKADEVLEDAGYAPFGFGYRRCPGELLTVEVIKDFLRRIHRERIRFEKIPIDTESATVSLEKIALGVGNMVRNDLTFTRGSGEDPS